MARTERADRRKPRRPLLVGLAVLCAAVAGASLPLEARDVEQAERDAVLRATGYVTDSIEPIVGGRASVTPLSASEASLLETRIDRATQGADVSAVRLWSPAGTLLFSTVGGEGARTDAPGQVRAAAGGSVQRAVTEDGSSLQAFVPVPTGGEPVAVAQVDQPYDAIAAAATERWQTVRLGAGGLAALFAAFLLLSLARKGRRTAPEPEEEAVTAQPESPRAEQPEQTRRRLGRKARAAASGGFGTAGSERPARRDDVSDDTLRKRLQKSEEARAALEEQLAQLRTQVAGDEARNEERTHVLTEQIADATARTRELEAMLGTSGTKAAPAPSGSPFARAAEEASADARIRELEAVATEAKTALEQAEARLAELEPLVAHSAARVEDAEARASQGAKDAEDRSKEALARQEEQAKRLQTAEARVQELEAYARDAEQRLAATTDAAQTSGSRIRELEAQLEGARHDQEALRRRLESLEAAGPSRSDHHGGEHAGEAEHRVAELQAQVAEMEGRVAELEELARGAEERATTARTEADEAARINAALDREVRELRVAGGAGPADVPERVRTLEAELADAHKAGIEAFRLAGEAKQALERTLQELEAERARSAELEQRFAAAIGELPSADPEAHVDPQAPNDPEGPNDPAVPEATPGEEPPAAEAADGEPSGGPPSDGALPNGEMSDGEVEDGPSLRFRLARSAAQRKGRKDPDQESGEVWTSSGRRA